MKFEEFNTYVKKHLNEYLPDFLKKETLSFGMVEKENGQKLHSISFQIEDGMVPMIYTEPFYTDFQQQGGGIYELKRTLADMGNLLGQRAEQIQDHRNIITMLGNTDYVKSKIMPVLVDHKRNYKRFQLEGIPYRYLPELDMDLYYRIILSMGSIAIHKQVAQSHQLSEESLYQIAMENLQNSKPCFQKISDYMVESGLVDPEMELFQEDIPLYICTSQTRMYGAAFLTAKDQLFEKVEEQLGEKIYIFPSSIHELLIIPQMMTLREAEQMVRSVNREVVSPEEYLSDHVYTYDREAKRITMAKETEKNLVRKPFKR